MPNVAMSGLCLVHAESNCINILKHHSRHLALKTLLHAYMMTGKEFDAKEVKTVAEKHGFKIRMSRPFSPSTNGKAEHKVVTRRSCAGL